MEFCVPQELRKYEKRIFSRLDKELLKRVSSEMEMTQINTTPSLSDDLAGITIPANCDKTFFDFKGIILPEAETKHQAARTRSTLGTEDCVLRKRKTLEASILEVQDSVQDVIIMKASYSDQYLGLREMEYLKTLEFKKAPSKVMRWNQILYDIHVFHWYFGDSFVGKNFLFPYAVLFLIPSMIKLTLISKQHQQYYVTSIIFCVCAFIFSNRISKFLSVLKNLEHIFFAQSERSHAIQRQATYSILRYHFCHRDFLPGGQHFVACFPSFLLLGYIPVVYIYINATFDPSLHWSERIEALLHLFFGLILYANVASMAMQLVDMFAMAVSKLRRFRYEYMLLAENGELCDSKPFRKNYMMIYDFIRNINTAWSTAGGFVMICFGILMAWSLIVEWFDSGVHFVLLSSERVDYYQIGGIFILSAMGLFVTVGTFARVNQIYPRILAMSRSRINIPADVIEIVERNPLWVKILGFVPTFQILVRFLILGIAFFLSKQLFK